MSTTLTAPTPTKKLAEEKDACGVGFVADTQNPASHEVLQEGLTALARNQHRGGVDAEGTTGDGAGIETQLPKELFEHFYKEAGGELGERDLGAGNFFLPQDKAKRTKVTALIEQTLQDMGFTDLKWRDVPTDDSVLGTKAAAAKPHLAQLMIPAKDGMDDKAFEMALFVARRKIENEINKNQEELVGEGADTFYTSSMSSKKIVYKGMTLATNLGDFYQDLGHESHTTEAPQYKTKYVKYHQRFSTNTTPVWERAHPFRLLAHNGEINTLKGNKNNMPALESLLRRAYGDDAEHLLPVIQAGGSDSADIDNVFEALYFAGYPLEAIKPFLVPEAYENDPHISEDHKNVYRYLSTLSAPWDGPATIALSDGEMILMGGDRSGFRPIRYAITSDGKVVAGSEDGSVDLDEEKITKLGNLRPGEMLAVNVKTGEILTDAQLKAMGFEAFQDDAAKVDRLKELQAETRPLDNYEFADDLLALRQRQRLFGYTEEIIEKDIGPMAEKGKEALGSMGHDAQEAYLAGKEFQLPFSHFFKQLFAQVTNPPIDSNRERMKMSLEVTLGSFENGEGEDFDRPPIHLSSPILSNRSFENLLGEMGDESVIIDTVFDVNRGAGAIEARIDQILQQAEQAALLGKHIVLSDIKVDDGHPPIPAQLVTSIVNAHLNSKGLRHQTSINVQTAEAHNAHDFATLIGMGANTVNAYLAEETVMASHTQGHYGDIPAEKALQNYIKANEDSVLKIMSKMGVATVNSYRGAMLFSAKGLDQGFVNKYFPGVESPIGGIGLGEIEHRILDHHQKNVGTDPEENLRKGGLNRKREGDQPHASDSWANRLLREAAAENDPKKSYEAHKLYTAHLDRSAEKDPVHVRDFMDFDTEGVKPVDIDDVESVEEIMKRFFSGAISFGSISPEAHESLAIAMNEIGGLSNCGEGGEHASRTGTDKESKVKQVASGRFGVTPEYLAPAEEIQIKVGQGAKPGLGGELPGHKVSVEIAGLRGCAEGTTLISPPPHHDIYSIEDLTQLIYDLKESNPTAKVNVKLVAAPGVETIAVGVAKAGADAICISGGTGGTGASPQTAINHSGHEFEEYLARVHSALIQNDLREGVKLTTDGSINRGRDMAVAAAMGADSYGMGMALLEAMGCQQARVCQFGTCPAGIATQMESLRKNFMAGKVKDIFKDLGKHADVMKKVMGALNIETQEELIAGLGDDDRKSEILSEFGKRAAAENVVNFLRNNAQEMRELMAKLGCKTMDDLIGHREFLKQVRGQDLGVDLEPALARDDLENEQGIHYKKGPRKEYRNPARPDHISWDRDQLAAHAKNILSDTPTTIEAKVGNEDRNIGTRITNRLIDKFGSAAAVPDDAVTLNLRGVAGQSLGTLATKGVNINLTGRANDYVGKGMAGANIVVKPSEICPVFENTQENIIVGNTCMYGATSGQLNAAGQAGNRFAVRNSGGVGIVEGAGDDACEYMCAGEVAILGEVGRNFGAGMSDGLAFIYDGSDTLRTTANEDVKDKIFNVADNAEMSAKLKARVEEHAAKTGSKHAFRLLGDWDNAVKDFKYVAPKAPANNNAAAPVSALA